MRQKLRMRGHTVLLLITALLFIVMYAAGCIVYANKGFAHAQTFLNLFINNAGLICVTCGMTCVMLTGGIDISVGALIAMDCMMISYATVNGSILGIPFTNTPFGAVSLLLFVLFIGIIFGIAQGYLVGGMGIQPFIVTMAGMFFARGMTAVISTQQLSVNNDFLYKWANLKINMPFAIGAYTNTKGKLMVPYIRVTVIVAIVVVILVALMLKYTKIGRKLYAIGGNRQSAKLMGLNVKRTTIFAYTLSSFLCSIGGICFCLTYMKGSVSQAMGLEMDSIASAVIGGTLLTGGVGNVFGSLAGVLINGTISTLINTNGKLIASWSNIATAALLCFFILVQSVFKLVRERRK